VAVVLVYIAEAHATDEWPISSARFNAGRGAVHVSQPRADADRCALARAFAADFGLADVPMLVDAAQGEQAEAYECAYAPWPLRFHGVVGARLGYVAHPRGCSYDLEPLRDWALAAAAEREQGGKTQ
jgi:hypothetical protein